MNKELSPEGRKDLARTLARILMKPKKETAPSKGA